MRQKKTKRTDYNPDSIKVLKGLDSIRKRPDMYVGSTTGKYSNGLYRLCREALDNAIDEYLANSCYTIQIHYDERTNRVTIADSGRGIPAGIHSDSGQNSMTLLFTEIHAGGKFFNDSDESSYKTSSGRNGVGQKAISALSSELQVWTSNTDSSKWATQTFAYGKCITDVELIPFKSVGLKDDCPIIVPKRGTIISWIPDETIFKDGIALPIKRLVSELKDIQYLCPKLKIDLYISKLDQSENEKISFYSEHGLSELVDQMAESTSEKVFTYTDDKLDVAVSFSKLEGSIFKSFVNVINTDQGGTHLDGFKKILCEGFKDKSKVNINAEDILEGVRGAIHYKSSDPQYQSQTKNELTSAEATEEVMNALRKPIRTFFNSEKELFNRILSYSEMMSQKRKKLREERDALKGIKKLNRSKYISEKFSDADRRKYPDPRSLELFIVEGDSAGGHFKLAREGFQACLKLRGKVINATKATYAQLFGSQKKNSTEEGNREIKDLTAALGCGISENYQEENLRFGKVIIMTDADPDGLHITNLILAFLMKYMPDLVANGHVYAIDAPLFLADGTGSGGKLHRVYGDTRQEVERGMANLGCSKYSITRMKGWGECNAEDLGSLCISPKSRKLIQVNLDSDYLISLNETMGEDSIYRKHILLKDE